MKNLNREILNYVANKRGAWSPSTIDTAYYKLCTIASIGLEPSSIWSTLNSEGYSRYTIKTYFILAAQFEKHVKKTTKIFDWMQSNRLNFQNVYKTKTKSMTVETYENLLSEAFNVEVYNFLILTGKAGLRKSEALNAKWEDIKNGELEVSSGKGNKQRFIPVDKAWFRDAKEEGQILPFNFLYKGDFYTPHDFRSFYADRVVNMPGMSIEDARDLLGHTDIRSTVKYLRINKERRARLIRENF